jgi:non-haem Fe2+, alpha-ketoglutarate-dependent halogenase
MNHHLTADEVDRFNQQGFLAPKRAFAAAEAGALRDRLEALERSTADTGLPIVRAGLHITTGWAWDLVHDPRIVQPVADLLGPNVLLWSMDWFIKEPGTKFVSYHQDATYWGLAPHHVVTAWVALSDASPATGPMKFVPGSHRGPLYEQEDTFVPDNMLSRGQVVKTTVDEGTVVMAPLGLGEMSLHHVRVIHGSDPNTTANRRIGMVLRYCATDVRQTKVDGDRAVLVQGQDDFHHFQLIDRPAQDQGERELALLREHARTRQRALHSKDLP